MDKDELLICGINQYVTLDSDIQFYHSLHKHALAADLVGALVGEHEVMLSSTSNCVRPWPATASLALHNKPTHL